MRALFLVQGEGRGHLTQAISLAQILQSAGHEVVAALVGIGDGRPVPSFFVEQMPAPVEAIPSQSLVYNRKTNELQPFRTIMRALSRIPLYARSLRRVQQVIGETKPDIIVNFYEQLGGLTYFFKRPDVPMVCVAHQYLMLHPDFPHPTGQPVSKFILKMNTQWTTIGASELLALSFDQQPDQPKLRSRVVPPLLRQDVLARKPTTEPFLLAYTTQPGLMEQLFEAHLKHKEVPIHAFHAGTKEPDRAVDETLTYHAIDGTRFLDFMARSRGVVTTAGFESVCEGLYLGKPALLIPQPNHYEQACNALDGKRIGAGVVSDRFDLDMLLTYMPNHDASVSERFRAWHAQGSHLFLSALTRAIANHKSVKSRKSKATILDNLADTKRSLSS
jgi:uncharacterized protein (TIGR00661 family)